MITFIFTLAYLASWVLFHKSQFLERDNFRWNPDTAKSANRQWHFWKGFNQIIFFGLLWYVFGFFNAAMCAAMYWVLFDSSMNRFVLKQGFFYVGSTAFIDRMTRKLAIFLKIKAPIVSAIGKSLLFTGILLVEYFRS